jgi:hypothetical protein
MDQTQVEEIELSMQYILDSHPARENKVVEDFESMMAESEAIESPEMVHASMPVQDASNPF